jgi:GNAT superfamily N-acetyltransferase
MRPSYNKFPRRAVPEVVTVRRAGFSDLDAIVGLRIDFERITRDSGSLDETRRRVELRVLLGPDLAAGRLLCWLAEAGGRAVAQSALRRRGRVLEGGEGEILNVYTDPAYRGRGIGTVLAGAAIAEARGLGLRRLKLQSTEDSRGIYERAGFRQAGGCMVVDLERL